MKCLVILLLTSLAAHAAAPAPVASPATPQAQPPASAYKLEASVDRAAALYKKGEPVACTITLTKEGKPVSDAEVTWTFSKDGLPPYENGKAMLKAGKVTATGKLDEPGFLQCRASFRETPTSAPITALAGAGIEPEAIKPSMPVPDDFETFWSAQKRKLASVPINPRLTPQASPSKTVEVFDVQADCVGAPVSAYFAKPAGAKPKSLPAILFVHGAGVNSSGLAASASWAANGALSMNMNAHGIPNGKPPEFYKSLAEGELKDYRFVGRDDREKNYFLGMFLRLVRAIDFLASQPEWNGKDVIVFGSSQGGYQAFAAGGVDERVTLICAGVPAGCDHTGIAVKRVNGWPKFIASLPGAEPDPKVLQTVRYFDNVNFATHTHAKEAVVTVGFIDTTCPPTSVYAAYNALPIKKQIYNDVKSGHANSPAAMKVMNDAAVKAIKAAAKP